MKTLLLFQRKNMLHIVYISMLSFHFAWFIVLNDKNVTAIEDLKTRRKSKAFISRNSPWSPRL